MPPIPTYTDSPIATKASGVVPQTTSVPAKDSEKVTATTTTTAAPTSAQFYPQAKPGAVPSLPTATTTAQSRGAYIPLIPTQGVNSDDRPPAPQPGAFPQPTKIHVPPPPKDGEKYVPSSATTSTPPSATVSYPLQMSIPPPTMAYPAQQSGTSSAVASGPTYGSQGGELGQNLQHPPGYHQDGNASELNRYQRTAMEQNDTTYHQQSEAEDDGVWNSAKKWAQATGEKLAAAETEVWKRINKE
ncbi:hypothetical protein TruAng_000003 [Truncatella angustata]|nr:hypothetical protein TruAng_000003 [Truncatella angustata]